MAAFKYNAIRALANLPQFLVFFHSIVSLARHHCIFHRGLWYPNLDVTQLWVSAAELLVWSALLQ